MKNTRFLAVLCLTLAVLMPPVFGQGRPRRVGAAPPTQPPARTTPSSPQPTSSQPGSDASDRVNQVGRPPAPPVLRGANRDPDEPQPTATPQKSNEPEEFGEGDILRVDTTLVSIPVSVMDRNGKFIPNLRKDDFHIWENGVAQQVAYFASVDKPFTVALVIDTSGSTESRIMEIQDAAITFVEQLRVDDRVMVVSFSDKIRVLAHPTSDRFTLRNAIRQVDAGGGTKLYDAVDMIINEYFNRIEGRKAMVLFTDGVDTSSKRGSYESTLRDAEELDALIYPVQFDTYNEMVGWPRRRGSGGSRRSGNILEDLIEIVLGGVTYDPSGNDPNSGGNNPGGGGSYPGGGGGNRRGGGGSGRTAGEYEVGERYLNDLARVTGARLYNAEMQNLDFAFRSVAEELRRQYSLGYYPKNKPVAGERRGIRVRVTRPELVVRTRDSYVFQPNANSSAQTSQPQAKPPVLKKDLWGNR